MARSDTKVFVEPVDRTPASGGIGRAPHPFSFVFVSGMVRCAVWLWRRVEGRAEELVPRGRAQGGTHKKHALHIGVVSYILCMKKYSDSRD